MAVFENVERCEVDLKFNSVCTKKHEKWHKKILWKIDFARDQPILWLKIGTLDNKSLQERPRLEKKTRTTSIVAIYWFSSDPCPINMLCFIDDLLIHSKVHLLCKKCIVHRKLWFVCNGQRQRKRHWERFSDRVTQLTFPDNRRNSDYDIEGWWLKVQVTSTTFATLVMFWNWNNIKEENWELSQNASLILQTSNY